MCSRRDIRNLLGVSLLQERKHPILVIFPGIIRERGNHRRWRWRNVLARKMARRG